MFELASLTHGVSGALYAYASVQVPMWVGSWRAGAPLGKLIYSPYVALPLAGVAALGMAAAGPWLQEMGMAEAGLLRLALQTGLSASVGYATGAAIAKKTLLVDQHKRGAVVMQVRAAREKQRWRDWLLGRERERRQATQESSVGVGMAGRHADRRGVSLAGLPVASLDESKHFKLVGTTGTGKSTAIGELLTGALARGDRAVIADPDGGYLGRFYDPRRGDIILNPFEPRSVRWDLFGEIASRHDIDQLARSLIPDHEGSDRSWRNYARTFLAAVTRQSQAAGHQDVRELYRLLVTAETNELRTLVAGTAAQPFLAEQNGRMFDSIRSVTSSAVGALEYVANQEAPAFSVRGWIAGTNGKAVGSKPAQRLSDQRGARGVLFIPYRAGEIAALRSTISAWMRLAIFEAMNQEQGDQRLWFVVDELDALGQIDGLKDALARLRKFGGRCVLGFQSIAQVSSTYGAGEAQTIVENCGNTLILRCSGSEHGGTSQFASRLIGQREVLRTTVSRTRAPGDWRTSSTQAEHFNIEPAVMSSQIEQLPDLSGYLKLASQPHWLQVRLPSPGLNAGAGGVRHSVVRPAAAAEIVAAVANGAAERTHDAGSIAAAAVPAQRIRRRAMSLWRQWRSAAVVIGTEPQHVTATATKQAEAVREAAAADDHP